MLRRILPTFIDTKYELIYSQERSLAKAVAATIIEPNPITVWDIMIPIIFILNLVKFKRAREVFTLNFLFTKKLALEAAYEMIMKDKAREEVIAKIEEKTSKILDADKKGIYSEKIRQRQMKEIELLIDHYLKLLNAEGREYSSLVRDGYKTKENYTRFLNQLKQAEKEVNRAALQTVGRTEEASEIVSKIEKATEEMRMAEVEKIFA